MIDWDGNLSGRTYSIIILSLRFFDASFVSILLGALPNRWG